MDKITVRLPGEVAIIKGVPFADLGALSALISELQSLWMLHGYALGELLQSPDLEVFKDLAQKIANLHPRLDTPGEAGFPIEPLLDDLDQFEAIFLLQRNEEDQLSLLKGGLILRLNRLDSEKKMIQAEQLMRQRQEIQLPASPPDSPAPSETAEATQPPPKSSKTGRSSGLRTSAES